MSIYCLFFGAYLPICQTGNVIIQEALLGEVNCRELLFSDNHLQIAIESLKFESLSIITIFSDIHPLLQVGS